MPSLARSWLSAATLQVVRALAQPHGLRRPRQASVKCHLGPMPCATPVPTPPTIRGSRNTQDGGVHTASDRARPPRHRPQATDCSAQQTTPCKASEYPELLVLSDQATPDRGESRPQQSRPTQKPVEYSPTARHDASSSTNDLSPIDLLHTSRPLRIQLSIFVPTHPPSDSCCRSTRIGQPRLLRFSSVIITEFSPP